MQILQISQDLLKKFLKISYLIGVTTNKLAVVIIRSIYENIQSYFSGLTFCRWFL